MISTDRLLFKKDSPVALRMVEYGTFCDSLAVIVFAKKSDGFSPITLSPRVSVYPTSSLYKAFYILDAISIGRKVGKEMKPSIVTAQDPFETGLVGWGVTRFLKAPLNIQIHTDFLSPYFFKHSLLNSLRLILSFFLIPQAYSIRVVSERIKKSIVNHRILRIHESRISVLPIFVDAERIRTAPVVASLKNKYPRFSRIVLMASRISKEKNIPLALDAFAELLKQMPDAGLVIVGSGPQLPYLQKRARDKGIKNSVVFEPWTDWEILVSFYKTADLFLVTSRYEGYGMALAEAASCRTPIISTDVGIAPEVGAQISPSVSTTLSEKILASLRYPTPSRVPDILSKQNYLRAYESTLSTISK
ncbi:MAG: glycosyltransferase [Patescibacteria group bacterium]